jgi:expansin (peptidoglycan-binding protein)
MRKSLFVLAALALVSLLATASFAADTTTVNGWISDSKCGVKGAHEGAAECTKKCLDGGASMVVVTDKDQKILTVKNPEALKGHEGHHVAVTGHVEGETIHVESAKML